VRPAPEAGTRTRAIASAVLGVIALGLVSCSRGGDLPPGAVKNEPFHFALVPPAGWTAVGPQDADVILAAYGDRLPQTFRARLKQPVTGRTSFVVGYVKTDAPGDLLPHIAVVFNSVGLPQVTDVEKERSRRTLAGKFRAAWSVATEESADIVEVDRLRAVRVAYSGTIVSSLHSAPRSSKTHRIRFVELMIPSKNMTHFLNLSAEEQQFDGYLATFNGVVSSFRSLGKK